MNFYVGCSSLTNEEKNPHRFSDLVCQNKFPLMLIFHCQFFVTVSSKVFLSYSS